MTAPLVLSRPQAAGPPLRSRSPRQRLADPPDSRQTGDSRQSGGQDGGATAGKADEGRNDSVRRDEGRIAATATSLAVACLEIFAGIRRSDSISRWVDRTLLDKIDQRAQLRAEVAPAKPIGELGASRTLQAGNARVCRVTESVAEVTVVVRTRNRFRAVAIRLELLTTRWTMTALQTM